MTVESPATLKDCIRCRMLSIRGTTDIISAGKCWNVVWRGRQVGWWDQYSVFNWVEQQQLSACSWERQWKTFSSLQFSSAPRLLATPNCFQPPNNSLCAMWTLTSCDSSPGYDEITVRRQKAGPSTQSVQPVKTISIDQLKVTIKYRCRRHYECHCQLSIQQIKCSVISYSWKNASIEINEERQKTLTLL